MKSHQKPLAGTFVLPQVAAQFVQDRKYSMKVTPATLTWYHAAFRTFDGCETRADYKARIRKLIDDGKSPVSINTWLRVINAYLHWVAVEGDETRKCNGGCTHLKIGRLHEDDKILQTFSMEQVRALLNTPPDSHDAKRIQVLVALVLDTGLRVAEALSLRKRDVDLESLLVKVMGKGRKERTVPLSLEGRKWLHLWTRGAGPDEYVFATGSGMALSIRNAQRDLRAWGAKVGITGVRCSPHTLRHTFAVTYIRAGGNLEYLRGILGHSKLDITQRYLRSLTPEDRQQVHNTFSALSRA